MHSKLQKARLQLENPCICSPALAKLVVRVCLSTADSHSHSDLAGRLDSSSQNFTATDFPVFLSAAVCWSVGLSVLQSVLTTPVYGVISALRLFRPKVRQPQGPGHKEAEAA
jgi:hypothetical protein